MPKEKLNQGHYKEAFDRCLCVSKILKEVVLSHPAVEQNEQITHIAQGTYSEVEAIAQLLMQKAKDNDGAIHDRAYWLFEMINELLLEHPVIAKDRNAKRFAGQTANALWKLYQYLGNKHFNDGESKHKPTGKRVRK